MKALPLHSLEVETTRSVSKGRNTKRKKSGSRFRDTGKSLRHSLYAIKRNSTERIFVANHTTFLTDCIGMQKRAWVLESGHLCLCFVGRDEGRYMIRSKSIYEATGTVVAMSTVQPATVRAYGNRQLRASSITEVPYTSVSRLRYCHTLLRHSIRVETYFCTS